MVTRKKTDTSKRPSTQQMIETVSVKVKTGTQYNQEGFEVFISRQMAVGGDTSELIDELTALAQEKVDKYAEEFLSDEVEHDPGDDDEEIVAQDDDEEVDDDDEGFADDDEEGDDAEGDDELTDEDVLAMKKPELVQLIKDEKLDIDVKDYKKIADLRNAIVDILFEEEEEGNDGGGEEADGGDEEGDWDPDEWDDED